MTDHNIVRMVHAIEERISGGGAADINSGGGVQASVDGTFLADVISVKPLSMQLQGQTVMCKTHLLFMESFYLVILIMTICGQLLMVMELQFHPDG